MSVTLPERIRLAHVHTPIEPLPRLRQWLEGPEIFFKRDDMTGIAKSGHKVRRLE